MVIVYFCKQINAVDSLFFESVFIIVIKLIYSTINQ